MKKLFLILLICGLIFLPTPLVASYNDDLIEIEVSAGQNNRQIGFKIINIDVVNNRQDNITVYYDYCFDSAYGMAIPKFYFENTTVASSESKDIIINVKDSIGDGWHPIIIYNFDLTVSAEEVQIEKKGFIFRQFVILWDPIGS
jgi:hypothetical protein